MSPPPGLGELEFAVLGHLWDRSAADAKAVHRAIGRDRRITLNTIQSTLKRLWEKGLLEREKVSHAHAYRPTLTREEFQRRALRDVVDRLMGGAPDAMLAAFVGLTESIGREQLEELERRVVERLRQVEGEASA